MLTHAISLAGMVEMNTFSTDQPIGEYVLGLRGSIEFGDAAERNVAIQAWKRDRAFYLRQYMKIKKRRVELLDTDTKEIWRTWIAIADRTVACGD